MFEPDDNYYSLTLKCRHFSGHDGPHQTWLKSENHPLLYPIIEINWMGGNVTLSNVEQVNVFPIGKWRNED